MSDPDISTDDTEVIASEPSSDTTYDDDAAVEQDNDPGGDTTE